MHDQKLILFDFDGVIIDGMDEYWYSSLMVCKKYSNSDSLPKNLNINKKVSNIFKEIRPYVNYGWEMVLITHEIIKQNQPLDDFSKDDFLKNYQQNCRNIIKNNSWDPTFLQSYLDDVRKSQISTDLNKWINLHKPFLPVISFIKKAQAKGFKIAIISTKSNLFTSEILNQFNVIPELIFGYQAGKKVNIISNLIEKYEIIGFIEDRKKTLLNIIEHNKTSEIKCFLADWGYLRSSDRLNLPNKITLIKLKDLKNLLAN